MVRSEVPMTQGTEKRECKRAKLKRVKLNQAAQVVTVIREALFRTISIPSTNPMTSRVPIQQDRSLLNPKFEGYKLSFLEESRLHFLPVGVPGSGISVPKLPSSAKLSYRQIQSRVRHNHLHPGWNSFKPVSGDSSSVRDGVLFAIDEECRLIVLQFDKARQGKA